MGLQVQKPALAEDPVLLQKIDGASAAGCGIAPGVKLIAYHPGTVASTLSEPFQANVPPQKLFTPERAAERLDTVMNSQTVDGALAYLDWAGEEIPW